MLTKIRPKGSGFTGFELLIVIALVGLLAWLVVGRFSELATDARNTERRLDISIVSAELEALHSLQDHYPASASALPSYLRFTADGQPQATPDTNAFIDPTGNFIQDSPTASTNAPTTGYDPAEIPDGGQYTYAPYGCSLAETGEATTNEAAADATNEETTDETTDGTTEVDETDENFSSCQSYVIYAWLEGDLVYSKVSTN